MTDSCVFTFDDPLPRDTPAVELLGAKGAALRALSQSGFPVPPGFTISIQACRDWLSGRGLFWDPLWKKMEWLEQRTGRRFGNTANPLLVAVRSGAAVSMPGALVSILNCGGEADPQQALRNAVETVIQSWNEPTAVAFRRRMQIDHDSATAVTVQAMVQTSVAGVCYSREPAGSDESGEVWLIEAALGLGDQVASGTTSPFCLRVPRGDTSDQVSIDSALRDMNAHGFPLDRDQLAELIDWARSAELHLGGDVDLEWGFAENQIVVLQVRPLLAGLNRDNEFARLRSQLDNDQSVLVRHNLSETLPHPTPLTWDLIRAFMSGSGGFGNLYRQLGYHPSKSLDEDGFLQLAAGQIYANVARIPDLFCAGLPLRYDLDKLVTDPSYLNRAPDVFDIERADSLFFFRLPWILWIFMRSRWRLDRLRSAAIAEFEQQFIPSMLALADTDQADLRRLSDDELATRFQGLHHHVFNQSAPQSLLPGMLGAMALERFKDELRGIVGESKANSLVRRWLASAMIDPQTDPTIALAEVGQGRLSADQFRQRYGHRAQAEMELAAPRWAERPDEITSLAKQLARSDIGQVAAGSNEQVREAEQQLIALLTEYGATSLANRILPQLKHAFRLLPFRERGKHYWMLGYQQIRSCAIEMGRRLQLGSDVFFLRADELTSAVRTGEGIDLLRDRLRTRKQQHAVCQRIELPRVLQPGAPLKVDNSAKAREGMVFEATSLAPGCATGTVRHCKPDTLPQTGRSGQILLAASMEVALTGLLDGAAAVITEQGGLLSHGANVARMLGVPAVVSAQAFDRLQDGDQVTVSGDDGRVICSSETNGSL